LIWCVRELLRGLGDERAVLPPSRTALEHGWQSASHAPELDVLLAVLAASSAIGTRAESVWFVHVSISTLCGKLVKRVRSLPDRE